MLLAGSSGNTEQEILGGLRIRDDMKEPDVHKGFKDLIIKLKVLIIITIAVQYRKPAKFKLIT